MALHLTFWFALAIQDHYRKLTNPLRCSKASNPILPMKILLTRVTMGVWACAGAAKAIPSCNRGIPWIFGG